jgi:hypothetical protein
MATNYFPFSNPTYSKKIVLPVEDTLVSKIPLPNFEINKERKYVSPEYNFIDTEKLLKLNKKKYTVDELREIAFKLNIPRTQSKLELVKAIRLKTGI